jgi:hypothetical protein
MPKEKLLGELICLDNTKNFSHQQPFTVVCFTVPLQYATVAL